MIVKMVLIILKLSGTAFRSMLGKVTREVGYMTSKTDPDVHLKQETKQREIRY